jgi:hypothetical protein
MITGVFDGGVLYSLTSVPQIPATSIFMSALSSGISGMGNSRISVLPGPVLTAASTFSTWVPLRVRVLARHFLMLGRVIPVVRLQGRRVQAHHRTVLRDSGHAEASAIIDSA